MKFIKHIWKMTVDIVIYLLAVVGLVTIPQYSDRWVFYLIYIVMCYYSIIMVMKSYKYLYNNEISKED